MGRVPSTRCSSSEPYRWQRMSEAHSHAFCREAGLAGLLGQGGLSHGQVVAVFPGLSYLYRTITLLVRAWRERASTAVSARDTVQGV